MTASIIAILQLTTTLTGYINDVRHATREQKEVVVEASSLLMLSVMHVTRQHMRQQEHHTNTIGSKRLMKMHTHRLPTLHHGARSKM
jgi:hypothetical protein